MRAEPEDFLDHFRQSPVPLKTVGLDSEAVVSLNIGFPEAGEARGDLVLALIIVHAHLLVFFEGGVVLAEDFSFGSSWTEFEFKVKVKVKVCFFLNGVPQLVHLPLHLSKKI